VEDIPWLSAPGQRPAWDLVHSRHLMNMRRIKAVIRPYLAYRLNTWEGNRKLNYRSLWYGFDSKKII
jgi:hypothetical protein